MTSSPWGLAGPAYGQQLFSDVNQAAPISPGSVYGGFGGYSGYGGYGGVYADQVPGLGHKRWAASTATDAKTPFARFARRRLNVLAIIVSLLLPWLLFTVEFCVSSLSVHYEQPGIYMLVVWGGFLGVFVAMGIAVGIWGKWFGSSEREPTWLIFLALTSFLAWTLAVVFGSSNYEHNMHPYFDMMNLNNYSNVSPAQMRGQQLMDAGGISFIAGTKLDLTKSMGFKNADVYCVAPITIGEASLATYDFWAVGLNCCSGNMANFRCEGFNDPRAIGGLRLMDDGQRSYFRLAVQQAEAAYNIKAVHPLFFHWVADPVHVVEGWRQTGWNECLAWISAHFVLQAFLVASAAFTFSKLGRL